MRSALVLFALICATTTYAAPNSMPARKPGLWEVKMQAPGMPQSMLSQHCIDEKTDHLLQPQGQTQARQQCSKNSMNKEGDKIIIESVCKIDNTTATTKAIFSGDFTRSYHGEIDTSFSPPMHGMKSSHQTLEGKWLGACKPGQKPGDVTMPGMGTMNLNDMMKNIPNGHQPRTPR